MISRLIGLSAVALFVVGLLMMPPPFAYSRGEFAWAYSIFCFDKENVLKAMTLFTPLSSEEKKVEIHRDLFGISGLRQDGYDSWERAKCTYHGYDIMILDADPKDRIDGVYFNHRITSMHAVRVALHRAPGRPRVYMASPIPVRTER